MTAPVSSVGPSEPLARTRFGAARLLRDAAALASSSLVNAVFGLVVWALTAHLFAPAELGVMTALLAIISAGALAMSAPIGDAYGAILSAAGARRCDVYRRGLSVLVVGATVAGAIGGGVAISSVDGARGSCQVFFLVLLGTIVLGVFQLQAATLAAIGRASWTVLLNVSVNILKIGLLLGLALAYRWHPLELATVLSSVVVCLVTIPAVGRIIRGPEGFIGGGTLSDAADVMDEFMRFIGRAFVAVFMGYAVFWLTPFLVMVFSDSTQSALYALSLPLAQTLDLMTAAMGTSLIVHASAEPGKAAAMARSMLIRCGALAIVGSIGIVVVAPLLLAHLNPAYGSMNVVGVMAVLCGASALRVPFATWSALQRSRRKLGPVLVVTSIGATVAVMGVVLLSRHYGALGGATGITIGYATMSLGAMVFAVRSRWARPDICHRDQ